MIEPILGQAKVDVLDGMPNNHDDSVMTRVEALLHVRCHHPGLWTRPDAQEIQHGHTYCLICVARSHLLEKVVI